MSHYSGVMLPTPEQGPGARSPDTETRPAPEPLNRVQALINSVDLISGVDRLADPASSQPWLQEQGLVVPGCFPTAEDLVTIRGFREALRALVAHKSGGPAPTEEQLAPLRDIASLATASVHLDTDGTLRLAPVGESLPGRLLALLLVIADAQRKGTWAQFKTCANQSCRKAFYDRSRNHGSTWCDMGRCGNRVNNRMFRARRSHRDTSD